MIVNLHGSLRQKYGDSIRIEASSVAEALEGLACQLHEWPRGLTVEIPGFDTEDLLQAKTDVKEIDIIPAMFGGSALGRILVGALLLVASALTIFAGPVGFAIGMMGLSMILGGVMSLFMKAPTLSKSNDPPVSKYFGANDNTAESGTPITLAYGRINLFGHWLSLQSDADVLVKGVFPSSPT